MHNSMINTSVNKNFIQRIAAKAIIINGANQILILREASTYQEGTNIGKYGLPGGRIEIGERYFDGLKREVKEETGLDIIADKPIFVSEWFPVIKDIPHQIIGIFYACKPLTTDVILSLEHDHYVWVNFQDMLQYNMTSADRQAIETWNGKYE
jgi:8-oxo-dGTP diphosphatase